MSVLDKATLVVRVMAILASGVIILQTTSSIADTTETNGLTSLKKASTVGPIAIDNSMMRVLEPPPGPFMDESMTARNIQMAPLFPEGPIKPILSISSAPKGLLSLSADPKEPSIKTKAPSQNKIVVTPSFDVTAPVKNIAPTFNRDSVQVNKSPVINSQNAPIWMQEIHRFGHNINKQQPVHVTQKQAVVSEGLIKNWNNHQVPQVPNINWSSQQQYIYVPIPLLPQYLAPQMPRYWQPAPVDSINLSAPNLKGNSK